MSTINLRLESNKMKKENKKKIETIFTQGKYELNGLLYSKLIPTIYEKEEVKRNFNFEYSESYGEVEDTEVQEEKCENEYQMDNSDEIISYNYDSDSQESIEMDDYLN